MNAQKSVLGGLKKNLLFVFKRITVTLLIIGLGATGCALMKLKKENAQGLASTALVGRISTAFPGNGPIVVAAYVMNQGKREVVNYTVLHDFGEFEILVAKGNYFVFAYWDKNSNLVYDAGEPAGQYGDPKKVIAPAGGVVGDINVSISKKPQKIEVPAGFEISSVKPRKLYSRMAGAIVDLEDERFSEDYGSKGYWEPYSFFKEFGGNIYFLEEYDPQKIPILFIHGATGTPKGWKYISDNIDRTRFQPWFFYYASGAPIKSSAYLLLWKLENLKLKYNFSQLYITAHSMGGLLARSFIMDHSTRFPYVKLFVSMATPWGGDRMAAYGVKQSPGVIPCWRDMQPESPFFKALYRKKMPKAVSFYMFYGHRGSRNPFRSNNDKTIAFSSLLDRRAQAEAKMNYAFNEDHASIIYSKAVVDQYNAIINAYSHPTGGHLKINYSYHHAFNDRPEPTLILQPVGKKGAEMEIKLRANDNGRILGPFPAGDYLAIFGSFTAIGKGKRKVKIKNKETSELNYVLTPDRVVYGTLISDVQSKDWGAGMPYTENFKVQSITLKGNGLYRELQLLEGDDVNLLDYYIPRADCYYKGNFFFFGLPTGEFELTIRAQDHKPFEKKLLINDGERIDPIVVELIPD